MGPDLYNCTDKLPAISVPNKDLDTYSALYQHSSHWLPMPYFLSKNISLYSTPAHRDPIYSLHALFLDLAFEVGYEVLRCSRYTKDPGLLCILVIEVAELVANFPGPTVLPWESATRTASNGLSSTTFSL